MKKLIAIMLSIVMILTAAPVTAYAEESTATAANSQSEVYFEPITVCGEEVFQGGQALDCVTEDGALLVDAEAFTDVVAETVSGEVTVSTEEGSITMTAGSDEALVATADGEETVTLETAPQQTDETLYIPLDDMASLCEIEVTQDGDTAVYSKPFQTKNLIARGSRIPRCGEVSREKLDGGYTLLHFETESETQAAYDVLSAAKTVSEVSGENVYSLYEWSAEDFALGENLSWGADYIDSPQLVEYVGEKHITSTVTVGIVDTGINTSHSLYKNRISQKSHSCVAAEPEVEDMEGHGSHVAGIVADNTPENVKILAVKGLNKEGQGTDSNLASAIRYAADNGADVINMSFGGPSSAVGSVLKNAVKYAYDKGVILVVAAGNEDADAKLSFPAASPYCITVAATDSDGDPAYFSNYGTAVDVAAPGVSIYSAYKNEGVADAFIRESGTSMASPFTAAACADALLLCGKMTPDKMKAYIKGKVTPYGAGSKYYGTGIISLTDYIGVTRSAPVTFSELSGSYEDALTVSLSCADNNAAIYYTTDGTAPDKTHGTRYTAPLTVADNTEIKAAAYSGSLYKSKTTKASYHFNAYDFDSNYIVNENGVITGYRGEMEDLCVQDVISGRRVTGISPTAFRDNVVVRLQLPDAVTEIPDNAFINCDMLESITAENVTKVGNNAFYNCDLRETHFGALESVGKYSFYGNPNLDEESLDISRLTEVPDYAFYQCGLTLLRNDSITAVGKNGFAYNNLLIVSLPKVKTVGEGAFGQCRALESASLPVAETLSKAAFKNCHKLAQFEAGSLVKIGEAAFDGCYPLAQLQTEKVTEIGQRSFSNTAIASLELPLVTELPDYAFYGMSRLEGVTLGSVRTVPAYAFGNTPMLSAVPDGVRGATLIKHNAFDGSGIVRADFPNAVTVQDCAFDNCKSIAEIALPSCVDFGKMRNIGGSDFKTLSLPHVIHFGAVENAAHLESVSLPIADSLGDGAFRGCSRLVRVEVPNVQTLGGHVFEGCASLTSLSLVSATGQLGAGCFNGCTSLKEVCLPLITEIVGGNTFRNCTALEFVDLSSAKNIGSMQDDFYGCESLKYILSPKATQVNGVEFYHCYALREWNLPACTNLSFAAYNSVNNGRDMDFVADVSIHAPKAEYLTFRHDTTYLSGYAIPAGVKSVAMNKKNTQTAKTLTFYAASDAADKIADGVLYEMHASPSIADNLPTAYTLSADSEPLTVRAFCADLVYTWFYAADGSHFTKINGAETNRIYPDKSGAYYCRVAERGTQSGADSAVCQVAAGETAVLTNSTGETLNILCNGVMFEQVANGATVTVPKGAAVRVLPNGTFHTLTAGGRTLTASPNTFDFTVGGNTVLKKGNEIPLQGCDIQLGIAARVKYTGRAIVPEPTVTDGGTKLQKNKHYTVDVFNNTEGGTATVVITGLAPYVGTVSKTFTIFSESLGNCTVTPIPTQTYTGSPLTPPLEVTLGGVKMTDYRITGYKNNVEAGTATVALIGCGTSLSGTRSVTFRIARSLEGAVLRVSPAKMTYTGSALKPTVTVTLGGKTLQADKDYTVSYSNNTAIGTGKVTVRGTGDYTGTLSADFTITAPAHPQNGWHQEGGKWYYYEKSQPVKGWRKLGGKWYLFAYADGRMLTGWQKSGGKWYYFNASGAMQTGWQKIGGKWYYFNASGAMLTGWQKLGGKWYYFNTGGDMKTGWLKDGGKWYYFNVSGAMLANTSQKIGSKTYKFNASGVCTNP